MSKSPKFNVGDQLAYTRNKDGSEVVGTVTNVHGRPPHHRDVVPEFWKSSAFDGSDFAYRLTGEAVKAVGHPVTIAEHRCHAAEPGAA